MPKQTLLWITTDATLPAEGEWRETLAEFSTVTASNLEEAVQVMAAEKVDGILLTGTIAETDAVDALDFLQQADPLVPVVVWHTEMRATEAVRLIRAGAWHCVGHRDTPETLRESLATAVEEHRHRVRCRQRASQRETWRNTLVGESPAMERVAETIRLVGARRCTVLITGETGTGKEMVARAIHQASPRAHQPLVAINCSALPEHLLEAELFGHVKGAFTGAINSRVGRFEQANRGTLFLDEIADMPIELQAKLLRVLQDREIQRLGSSENIKVDVRVIAATNVNLQERVRQGKFREDLFYRLNVVPLQVPALRDRASDIPLLVEHFVAKVCEIEGVPVKSIAPDAMDRLASSQWPGNVRQLENAVEMAVALSGEREILFSSDFGLAAAPPPRVIPFQPAATAVEIADTLDFETAVNLFERSILERALEKTAGNKTAAAEMLGLKRTTLIMKLRSFQNSAPAMVS